MPKKIEGVTHVTRGNIFADLGFSKSEAAALEIKADLLDAILNEIECHQYSQRRLIQILDEHQPAVSNLMRGKITQVSIEKLLQYSDRLGLRAKLKIQPPRRAVRAA
jgi:predicted XRE-type DNA-binding protein